MNADLPFAFISIGIGLIFILVGLLHRIPAFGHWDAAIFQRLHSRLQPCAGFFRFLWPLGTTPVGIMLILIIFIASWQAGLVTALVYSIAALVEHLIKRSLKRPRPYQMLADVEMSQPKPPGDPSHPSGDAMRVWFLALIFPLSFELPVPIFAFTISAALTLSLGRIVLGVHYPLDVIGGAGLGFLSTAVVVLSYPFTVMR
jgi:undecaprenyl-diphosphatase